MPRRLYPCTPNRLRSWLDCPRRYRMTYLDRPAPQKGPPWAHNSLGASVHNALAGWWRLKREERTPEAAGGLLAGGWITEGYADDAQSADYLRGSRSCTMCRRERCCAGSTALRRLTGSCAAPRTSPARAQRPTSGTSPILNPAGGMRSSLRPLVRGAAGATSVRSARRAGPRPLGGGRGTAWPSSHRRGRYRSAHRRDSAWFQNALSIAAVVSGASTAGEWPAPGMQIRSAPSRFA